MTKQTVQAGWDLFLRLLDCHYDKPLAAVAEEDEGKNDPGPPSKRQKQTPQPRAKASKIAKVIRLTELESDDPDFATGIKEQAPGYVLVGLTDPRAREVSTRPIVMVCRWTGLSVACMVSLCLSLTCSLAQPPTALMALSELIELALSSPGKPS